MKSVLASQITKALLLTFLTTSFVACKTVEQGSDFSSRAPASSSLVSGKKSLQQSRSVNRQGPGDGSGGNGINGKVFESYIVSLTDLSEFKKYVEPVLKSLDSNDPDSKETKTTEALNLMKTWYIAPVKLKPIDNTVLGVSFSEDKSEQLAIQTRHSVWIDKKKWDANKDDRARGMLLLHEITMSLYLFQFEDLRTLCKQVGSECGTITDAANSHRKLKPTPRRALTKDDYENIRAATFWLAQYGKTSTPMQTRKMLGSKNFDPRFFGAEALSNYNEDGTYNSKQVTYSSAEILASLNRSQVLQTMPDKCYAVNAKVHFDCKITIAEGQATNASGAVIPGAVLTVSGENYHRETVVYGGDYLTGSSPELHDANDAFPMTLSGPISCAIGSKTQLMTAYVNGEPATGSKAREVLAITIAPYVVFETNKSIAGLAQPKPTALEQDNIIAYKSNTDTNLEYLQEDMQSDMNRTLERMCN